MPLADVEIRDALNPDPPPAEQVPGRVWYNSNTDELKYHNRNRDVVVINSQNIQTLIETDINNQRMEHHQNTDGDFSFTQETTQAPMAQRSVLTNPPRWEVNRVDAGGGPAVATLSSLRYDSNAGDHGTLHIFVSDSSLSGTDAGRKQALNWWNTEFQQNQQDAMDGIITWLDPADQVGFTGRITAVGNVPMGRVRGPVSRGEAYLEIEITGFENGNTCLLYTSPSPRDS